MSTFQPAFPHIPGMGSAGDARVQAMLNQNGTTNGSDLTTLGSLASIFGDPANAFMFPKDAPVTRSNLSEMIDTFYNNRTLIIPSNKVDLKLMFNPFAPFIAAFYPLILTHEQKITVIEHYINVLPHTPTAHHVPGRTMTSTDNTWGVTKQTYAAGVIINTLLLLDPNQVGQVVEDAVNGIVYSTFQTVALVCLQWTLAQGLVGRFANDRNEYDSATDFLVLAQNFGALNRGIDVWFNIMTQSARIVRPAAGRTKVLLITPPGRTNDMFHQLKPNDATGVKDYIQVQHPTTKDLLTTAVEYAPGVPVGRPTIANPNLEIHELPDIPISEKRSLPSLLRNVTTVGQYYGPRQIKLAQSINNTYTENSNVYFLYNPESDNYEPVTYEQTILNCNIWDNETGDYSLACKRLVEQYNDKGNPRPEHVVSTQDARRALRTPNFLPPSFASRTNDDFMFAIFRRKKHEWDLAHIIGDLTEHHLPNSYILWAAQRMLTIPGFGAKFGLFITKLKELVEDLNNRPPHELWYEAVINANLHNYAVKVDDEWQANLEAAVEGRNQPYALIPQIRGNVFGSLDLPTVPPQIPVQHYFAGYGNGPGIRTIAQMAHYTSAYGTLPQFANEVVGLWNEIKDQLLRMLGSSTMLNTKMLPAFFGPRAEDPFTALVANMFGGAPLFLCVTQPDNTINAQPTPQQDIVMLQGLFLDDQNEPLSMILDNNYLITVLKTVHPIGPAGNIKPDEILKALSGPDSMLPIIFKRLSALPLGKTTFAKYPIIHQTLIVLQAMIQLQHNSKQITIDDVVTTATSLFFAGTTQTEDALLKMKKTYDSLTELMRETIHSKLSIRHVPQNFSVSDVSTFAALQAHIRYLLLNFSTRLVVDSAIFDYSAPTSGDKVIQFTTPQPNPPIAITFEQLLRADKNDNTTKWADVKSVSKWLDDSYLERTILELRQLVSKIRPLHHAANEANRYLLSVQQSSTHKNATAAYVRSPLTINKRHNAELYFTMGIRHPDFPPAVPGDYTTGHGSPAISAKYLWPDDSPVEKITPSLYTFLQTEYAKYTTERPEPSHARTRPTILHDTFRSAHAYAGSEDVEFALEQDAAANVRPGTFLGVSVHNSAILQHLNFVELLDGPLFDRISDLNNLAQTCSPSERCLMLLYTTLPLNQGAMIALARTHQLLPFDALTMRFIQVETSNDILMGDGAGQLFASPAVVSLANDNKHMSAFMNSNISFGIVPRTANGVLIAMHTQIHQLIAGMNTQFMSIEDVADMTTKSRTSADPSLIAVVMPVTENLPSVLRWDGGNIDYRIGDQFKIPITQGGISTINSFYRLLFQPILYSNAAYSNARAPLFKKSVLGDNKTTFYPDMATIFNATFAVSPFSQYIAAGPYMYKNRHNQEVQVAGVGPLSQRFEQMPGAAGPYMNSGSMYFPTLHMDSPTSVVSKTFV